MPDRMRRVNAILLPLIAAEVEDLKDPRLGFVTLTGVDTAPNLRNADVFFAVIGSEEEIAGTVEALESAAPRITYEVGRQVHLKYTPRLHFHLDRSAERGVHMAEVFRRLRDEEE
ncbi:MAG: 30S ribosome-binding factor RbfA [Acidimicrobiia bacterium]|nr:30S ribosome-binding factor RbfA [Acidimicrobiia bacterium]